jgi:hypothetical protein
MRLETTRSVHGGRAEECWELYERAFGDLRIRAVQRHVMLRDEFDQVLADTRVTKYVGVEDGACSALATVATELEAMPLVSPEYFAHRWPQLYAAGHIWYVGFVVIRPDLQRGPLFGQIVRDVGAAAAAVGGVAAMDVSRHVARQRRLPEALARYFTRLAPGTHVTRLDEQSFWAYEFPPAGAGAVDTSAAGPAADGPVGRG